jgi:hypothetical protein
VKGLVQKLSFGFLVGNIVLSSLFGSCSPYLGFHDFGSQLFLEEAPLALGPNFGPSVEFWVRLPLLKTQVHVAIAFGTTRGIGTKTPLTFSCDFIGESRSALPRRKLECKNHAS